MDKTNIRQTGSRFLLRSVNLKKPTKIPTRIVPSVSCADLSPRQIDREFRKIIGDWSTLRVAGKARNAPQLLWTMGLRPRHKIELFETRFYLTSVKQIPELRFVVAYVVQPASSQRGHVSARIFYKDLSLTWRVASHFTLVDDELWVGKGDVRDASDDDYDIWLSDESTTDLPLEIQSAVESVLTHTRRPRGSQEILDLILRQGPANRVEPYVDFTRPRIQAQANSDNLIHNNQPIAWFRQPGDPTSLKIVHGYEPDFKRGVIERSTSRSRLYGGTLRRFRILSCNQTIQYYFFAGRRHVWLLPPQATTTQLSSYGVRTIDVVADDDLFVPGYEYHHYEETERGVELYSQIPAGFAGHVCPVDDMKADATPWLDKIPLIQQFRREMLSSHGKN